MAQNQKIHPLASYHDAIAENSNSLRFTHHPVPDFEGLISAPQGFGRPFFHRPTNTIVVLFSKTSNNLRGHKVDGRLVADADQMKGCYIFAARRLKGDVNDPLSARPNIESVEIDLREDMDIKRRELGRRSRTHFTLHHADNLYTNGRHVYEILECKNGDFKVVFRMATRRKDGHFVPFDMNDKGLRSIFSRANRTLAVTKTHDEACKVVAKHWKDFSSDLWSERNIFKSQGIGVIAKKFLCDLVHTTMNHGMIVAGTTAIVGTGLSIKYGPSLGFAGALTLGFGTAAAHTLTSLPVELGLKEYRERRTKSSEARRKLDISAYGFGEDVSDHFKIQTPEEIAKVCPHIDMERFKAEDFEPLTLDQFSLQKNREMAQENLDPLSLAGHLLFMGHRGSSSVAHILDSRPETRTELRLFQNGVSRVMHKRKVKDPDTDKYIDKFIVYAQYRPGMCDKNRLRLAKDYRDQFQGKIVRLEYYPSKATFAEGIGQGIQFVSYESMLDEIKNDFLSCGADPNSKKAWEQSCKSLDNAFCDPTLSLFEQMKKPTIVASPKLSASLGHMNISMSNEVALV